MFKHMDKGPYNLIVEKTDIEQYEFAVMVKKTKPKRHKQNNKYLQQ